MLLSSFALLEGLEIGIIRGNGGFPWRRMFSLRRSPLGSVSGERMGRDHKGVQTDIFAMGLVQARSCLRAGFPQAGRPVGWLRRPGVFEKWSAISKVILKVMPLI